MPHPTFSTTLAEQHRDQLRRQADRWRLARSIRADRRPGRSISRRWWRPAARPARA